jgi:hypothetical protein
MNTHWIGIDGEGYGTHPHRYFLLASSDAHGRSDYVQNPYGLSSAAALEFLASLGRYSENIRVAGYFLGYDWTMILRDLPNRAIYRLLRPETRRTGKGRFAWIRWRGFALHYIGGMMRIRAGDRRVQVWDLGKFFQTRFDKALVKWGVEADIAHIARMKEARDEFLERDADAIRAYCLAECAALARLAGKLEDALEAADMLPKRWHGPGSVASVLLERAEAHELRGDPPGLIQERASRAFFGGRFISAAFARRPR